MTSRDFPPTIFSMKRYIDTRHGRIWSQLHDCPAAKAVVISYGGSGEYRTVDTWSNESLARWLNDHAYSMFSFDKWGCGESEGPWREVTLDILMETALDLIVQLRKERQTPIFYLGQSEGSKLGFEIATQTSSCDAYALRVPSHQDIESRLRYQILEMNKDTEAWDIWRQGISQIKDDLSKGRKVEGFLYNFPRTFWASALGRKQPADFISRIRSPFFVLNGDVDPFTPSVAYQVLHDAIEADPSPLRRAKVYAGVGHGLNEDNEPWRVSLAAKDIIKWFDEVRGALHL